MPPPPFDATAKLHAKSLAASHGKPMTRDEGLKALHAVLHVKTAEAALRHFGVSRQRFSEWTQIVRNAATSGIPEPQKIPAPYEPDALLLSDDWLKTNLQMLRVLNVGPVDLSADCRSGTRLVSVELLGWDETDTVQQTVSIPYDCAPPQGAGSLVDAQARRKRNRRNEEVALQKLDGVARAEQLLEKRQRRQELRTSEQAVADRETAKEVRSWLEDLLLQVEEMALAAAESDAHKECVALYSQWLDADAAMCIDCSEDVQADARERYNAYVAKRSQGCLTHGFQHSRCKCWRGSDSADACDCQHCFGADNAGMPNQIRAAQYLAELRHVRETGASHPHPFVHGAALDWRVRGRGGFYGSTPFSISQDCQFDPGLTGHFPSFDELITLRQHMRDITPPPPYHTDGLGDRAQRALRTVIPPPVLTPPVKSMDLDWMSGLCRQATKRVVSMDEVADASLNELGSMHRLDTVMVVALTSAGLAKVTDDSGNLVKPIHRVCWRPPVRCNGVSIMHWHEPAQVKLEREDGVGILTVNGCGLQLRDVQLALQEQFDRESDVDSCDSCDESGSECGHELEDSSDGRRERVTQSDSGSSACDHDQAETWMAEPEAASDDDSDPEVVDSLPDPEELPTLPQNPEVAYLEPWTWMPEREDPSDDERESEVADTLPDPEELQAAQQWGGGGITISEDSQASDPVMSSLIELLAMLLRALWFMIWLVVEIIRGIYLMQRARTAVKAA